MVCVLRLDPPGKAVSHDIPNLPASAGKSEIYPQTFCASLASHKVQETPVVVELLSSYADVMKREMGERPELPACFNED